jgi:hypothetical protein
MKGYQTYKRSVLTISIIFFSVALLTTCINEQKENDTQQEEPIGAAKKVQWQEFAGSASCAACHKSIHESHMNTSHYLTSQPISPANVKGSFDSGRNSFAFNARIKVVMEKRSDSLYQVAYQNNVEKLSKRFDIVIGSGTKGQSYLSWTKNGLFQLPITYFILIH